MKNLIKAKMIAESNRNSISDWLKKAVEVREFEPFVQQAHDVLSFWAVRTGTGKREKGGKTDQGDRHNISRTCLISL